MQKKAFIIIDFMPTFVFLDCYIIYRLLRRWLVAYEDYSIH